MEIKLKILQFMLGLGRQTNMRKVFFIIDAAQWSERVIKPMAISI